MKFTILNNPNAESDRKNARLFCSAFFEECERPKFILGRNIYAISIADYVDVDGFIDDYTDEQFYLGRPIVKLSKVPPEALVINAAGGRPLSAGARLTDAGLTHLDYFSVYKNSGYPLIAMRFNEGFEEDLANNEDKYCWINELLEDEESKVIFRKLVSFRADYDIHHLSGFTWREDLQYFENFLKLNGENETFIDVGGFDGFTSVEFIKKCPDYKSVHIFEPEPSNYQNCLKRLAPYQNIHIHNLGLSNIRTNLKINVQGSASTVSEDGIVSIKVDRLDAVLTEDIATFIKIDIEGEEIAALEGAQDIIKQHHPRLAISIYHRAGDFWRIPELVLSIRNDYKIYVRHYTECIYETVMFFVPKLEDQE